MDVYDIGILGSGVAGTFAIQQINKSAPNTKLLVIEMGRPPLKRRSQMCGWLGCLPSSDGKFFVKEPDNVYRKDYKSAHEKLIKVLDKVINTSKLLKNNPNPSFIKRLNKNNFEYECNEYLQLYPKDIHTLSKYISEEVENENITNAFDEEIKSIKRENDQFVIETEYNTFICKKILLATGRSGWKFANSIFKNFGIISDEKSCEFGIRVEADSTFFSDLKESWCTLRKDNVSYGPFCWSGTVIPEDHVDFAISAFRGNENRWQTVKTSFSILKKVEFDKDAVYQLDRLGKLTFLMTNDRILKEKIASIMNDKSKVSILKEYSWVKEALKNIDVLFPELISKGFFHTPTLYPMASKVDVSKTFETGVKDLFVAGESAGYKGLYNAAITGIIAGTYLTK